MEGFNYDIGETKLVRNVKPIIDFKPEMVDYMIGDENSLKFQYIKEIEDVDERIEKMSKYLREDIIKQPFPDEFYTWYARDVLGIKYKKHEIDSLKREYRIKKKREKKKEQEELKKQKQLAKHKGIKFVNEKRVITF